MDEPQSSRSNFESRDGSFTGTNLAFIGYSFDKNVIANNDAAMKSSANTDSGAVLEKKLTTLESNLVKMDSQLKVETEKYQKMAKENERLEKQVKLLEADVATKSTSESNLEASLKEVGKQKEMLLFEIDEMKRKLAKESEGKNRLELELTAANEKLLQHSFHESNQHAPSC